MNIKKSISATVAIIAIVCLAATVRSFAAPENTSTTVTSSADTKKFVKTKNKCSKCSCLGYWGYKHQNGAYEGACSNRDSHGYTCGHGPEKHRLKKW